MTLHLKSSLSVSLSSTSNEERDKGNPSLSLLMATAQEGGTWHRIVAPEAADLPLELPGIADAKFLMVLTNVQTVGEDAVPLLFKLNDVGNAPITVAPDDNGRGVLVLSTSGLAALFVSNPDVAIGMEVTWLAVGD